MLAPTVEEFPGDPAGCGWSDGSAQLYSNLECAALSLKGGKPRNRDVLCVSGWPPWLSNYFPLAVGNQTRHHLTSVTFVWVQVLPRSLSWVHVEPARSPREPTNLRGDNRVTFIELHFLALKEFLYYTQRSHSFFLLIYKPRAPISAPPFREKEKKICSRGPMGGKMEGQIELHFFCWNQLWGF